MAQGPLVTVVLLNRNQRLATVRCLKSLQAVAYSNLKVVVVDNGSVDSSLHEFSSLLPGLTILSSQKNLGCSGGRNLALQYAMAHDTEYILFLDNDTEVVPDFLIHLLRTAESESKIGIVSSKIVNHQDRSLMWMAGGRLDQKCRATALYFGEPVTNVERTAYEVDWVPGCVLLVKRCVVEAIGYFDNAYFIYFEDIDWCWKATRNGYSIFVNPQSVVFHEPSQAFGGPTSRAKRYLMTRNRLLFSSRATKGWNKVSSVCTFVLEELTSIIKEILSNKSKLALARFHGLFHFIIRRFGNVPPLWDVKPTQKV